MLNRISPTHLQSSFDTLKKSHNSQIQALQRVQSFLELVSISELKCAKILNEIEEQNFELLHGVLTPGVIGFLESVKSGCASKAL